MMAIRILGAVAVAATVMLQATALPRRIFNAMDINHHPVNPPTQNITIPEPWVCPNPDLELDPIECPPGTKGGVPKAIDLFRVRVGCNGLRCPHEWVYVDAGMPRFEHTCPRHAVVAAANWRKWCRLNPPFYIEPMGFCGTGSEPMDATMDAPSIERCCGQWVSVKDPYYKDYPTAIRPDLSVVENKIEEGEEMRRVLKPHAWEFNIDNGFCRTWMAEDEATFQYFMQNLGSWDVDDADLLGHGGPRYNIIWDQDMAWGHLPE